MLISKQNLDLVFKGFKTVYTASFDGTKSYKDTLAMSVSSQSREEQYGWLGQFPALRKWVGDRHVKALTSHGFSIKNEKFESTVSIDRDDISDDRLGIYSPMFSEMGRVSKQHPDTLIFDLMMKGFETMCFDGQNFFDTDHPVGQPGQEASVSNMQAGAGEIWILADLSRPLKPFIFQKRRDYEFTTKEDGRTSDHVFMKDQYLYGVDARVAAGFGFWQMAFGSKAELTSANLRAAYTAMTNFTDDEGRKLNIRPTHLIVGNTNHFKARDILMSEQVNGTTNTDRNLVQLMHAPLLG